MALLGEQELTTASCGHETLVDLSELPIERRAGRVAWIQEKGRCAACFRAKRDKDRTAERTEWLAAKRAEELAEAADFEQAADLPDLDGSERAVAWARTVRTDLLKRAHDVLVFTGGGDELSFVADVEEPARLIARAGWWIDQKDADPGDLPALLEAGVDDPVNLIACENTL